MQLSEQEFIDREQRKLDARLLRQLKAVNTHAKISREAIETLLINGLVEFGGPSESYPYNHDRLTAFGRSELERLILLKAIQG